MVSRGQGLGLALVVSLAMLISLGWESSDQQTWAEQLVPASGGGSLTSYLVESDNRPARLIVVDSQRLCVEAYEIGRDKGEIRFLSSRSIVYDLQMTGYNTEELKPEDIKKMLDRQN